MRHKPEVFIIESLYLEDEDRDRTEGRFLAHLLKLDGKKPRYRYLRSRYELGKVLNEFRRSEYRYLHLSSHGSKTVIRTTFDRIGFLSFGNLVRPYLTDKRIFISACKAANRDLAREIFRIPGCISLIGPKHSPYFGEAAIFWASFYHVMFEINEAGMVKDDIKPTLTALQRIFNFPLNYFTRSSRNSLGFKQVQLPLVS